MRRDEIMIRTYIIKGLICIALFMLGVYTFNNSPLPFIGILIAIIYPFIILIGYLERFFDEI